MGILDTFVILTMISLAFSVIIIIIGMSSKNKRIKNICFSIGFFIIPFIFMLVLFGIVIPFVFIGLTFKGYNGIIGILMLIFGSWLIVTLIIRFKNRIMILKNNEEKIYVRDIEVDYSPAVVSYLMNNKIEIKKDLSATLLNLCSKNILKIEKDENQQVKIIDLNNKKEVEKLKDDEKYAYEMFKTELTTSKISKWKNIVKKEYDKYKFSKENKIDLSSYFMYIYAAIIIIGIIVVSRGMIVNGESAELLMKIIVIVFFSAWELGVIKAIRMFTKSSEFIETYTKKGALEYNRWKKFEKFIEEYTLIKEKEYENVVILGEYLAYATALEINQKCDKELYNEINKKFDFDIFSYFDGMNIEEKQN